MGRYEDKIELERDRANSIVVAEVNDAGKMTMVKNNNKRPELFLFVMVGGCK